MISATGRGDRGRDQQEADVIRLLAELGADGLYDERDPKDQTRDLLERHGEHLTETQRAMVQRASDVELSYAGWIQEADSFGLHVRVSEDNHQAEEYRLTFRKPNWASRSGPTSELFQDLEALLRRMAKLRASGPVSYIHVTKRPVGAWQDFTSVAEMLLDEEP